jgi:preprotein translocase subunit YajC
MGNIFWLLLPVMVVMLLVSFMGQKKQKKQQESLLSGLKRGDQVMTTAGILGSVVEINDRDVLLRVDEGSNTRIRFAKSAIQQVLREGRDAARADVELKPKTEATSAR